MESLFCLCLWNALELLLFLTVSGEGLPVLPCSSQGPALYSLVFQGKWSPRAFPKQYPRYRPPAQWSPLIAVTHSNKYRLWRLGSKARPGVREFAEKGANATLKQEIKKAKNKIHSIGGYFTAPAIRSGVGETSIMLLIHPTHPLLSFMVRIVPSPDWFVGYDSIILCQGEDWKEDITLDLYPYDAGTDSGFTFSSPNFATAPQDTITQITSSFPNHRANSFYYPRLHHLPPMARVMLHKSKGQQLVGMPAMKFNLISPDRESEILSETPLDCEVSIWSSWGLCDGDCGQFGISRRTRFIHTKPANNGAVCPELEQEIKCIPTNCFL
ncbi:spondin-2-like [Callorhinchus milii]|uniref:spondin-2-like n=1 Tax=Callorhinchus milii TaxID=7868 RepID=UPI0004576278|nr:spondin-2-like [Callorhinchus milii]|eukprot:gi/632948636/ref/XP_007889703.1/ PREDICTED: spondin-2-like [Callorhinchus milii]